MKKFFPFISSPLMLISLSLPLLVWFAAAAIGMGLAPLDAASAVSFRIFYAALLVSLSVAVYNSVRVRSYGAGLISFGVILLLFQGIYLYGFWFTGKAGIGEGESFSKYDAVAAGPWSRPVPVPFMLKTARSGVSDTSTVILDGQEKEMVKDRPVVWNGLKLTITPTSYAPLFILSNAQGIELEGGYVKLAFDDLESANFQFRVVPHRFYVSLPSRGGKRWKREGQGWTRDDGRGRMDEGRGKREDAPRAQEKTGTLHLKIVRGKMTLLTQDVKPGESVAFDGHKVRFEQGAPWIGVSVEKVQKSYLLYAGLAIILIGGIMRIRGRRAA